MKWKGEYGGGERKGLGGREEHSCGSQGLGLWFTGRNKKGV